VRLVNSATPEIDISKTEFATDKRELNKIKNNHHLMIDAKQRKTNLSLTLNPNPRNLFETQKSCNSPFCSSHISSPNKQTDTP
jgi:hypothetical protein